MARITNKGIAIFGIVAYVLSVLASAIDSEGNSVAPLGILVLSALTITIFVVWAFIRLRKNAKVLAFIFIVSAIAIPLLEAIAFTDGSALVLLLNLIRIIYLISTIFVIVKLFQMKNEIK